MIANARLMNEEHEGKSGHGLWFVALIAALCLYVLSIGPAAVIAKKTGSDGSIIRMVYAPVIWLHDYTILRQPLEKYVEMWGVH